MTDGPSQSLSIAGQPSAYGDTFVAIDLMKGVDAFRYSDPTGPVADPHVPLSALRLDAKGWLKSLPVIDGVPQTVWGNIIYTQALPPGKYILEWQGEGSITTWTDHTQIAPNKLLVDFTANYINDQGNPKDDGVTVIVSATDPNHTGNYLRDIKFYREQDADLIAAGDHFNPDWFNRVDDFRVLRTHDWQSTNFPNVVDWSRNNYAADQAVWGLEGRGMPYELLVELANQTRSDLWITIPHRASDQFIANAAAYLHAHLDPDLRITPEFSTEYWTSIFDQYAWFQAGGVANYPNAAFSAGQFYGTKAEHMADIFRAEFGAGSMQLNPVLTTNHAMFASGAAEKILRAPAEVAKGGAAPYTHGFKILATDG